MQLPIIIIIALRLDTFIAIMLVNLPMSISALVEVQIVDAAGVALRLEVGVVWAAVRDGAEGGQTVAIVFVAGKVLVFLHVAVVDDVEVC